MRQLGAAIIVAVLASAGSALAQDGQAPPYDGEHITDLAGLDLQATKDIDVVLAWQIATICDNAARAYRGLGLVGPEVVTVKVSATQGPHPSVVTDRRSTLYVSYLAGGAGIGEWTRKYPQPVGILCKAVAELFNPHRVPGLERTLSALVAVPAVARAVGEGAWERPYDYAALDGAEVFNTQCGDAALLAEHPDWAAASAVSQLLDQLGTEWLVQQLGGLQVDRAAALAELRKAAVAAEPTLDDLFQPWDLATDLRLEPDGSLVLSSFEADGDEAMFPVRQQAVVTRSTEWATDGQRCGVFTFNGPGDWPSVGLREEDWRYKDWSRFASLEFDVRNPSATDATLRCAAFDTPDRGHGHIQKTFVIGAGEEKHCVVRLDPPPEWPWQTAVYWEGHTRLAEMCQLLFFLPAGHQLPLTLWVDDIRLRQ